MGHKQIQQKINSEHMITKNRIMIFVRIMGCNLAQIIEQKKYIQIFQNIKYSSKHTMSIVQTQQIKLLTVFSSAEERLQSNFEAIMKKIMEHQRMINRNSSIIEEVRKQNHFEIEQIEKKMLENNENMFARIQMVKNSIKNLEYQQNQNDIKFLQKQQDINSLFQSAKFCNQRYAGQICSKLYELQVISQQVLKITGEMKSLQNILRQKQNRNDSQVTRRTIQQIQEKIQTQNQQFKYLEFKVEKMDLLSQKNQSSQKKQLGKIKEIQEKLKKQIRMSRRESVQTFDERVVDNFINENIEGYKKINRADSLDSPMLRRREPQPMKQSSFANQSVFKPHHERLLNSLNDRLTRLENRTQDNHEKVSNLDEIINEKINKMMPSNNNFSQINEKLNSIRPQLIKLWSKCDGIEDKTTFIDRKIEEKSRLIAQIMQQLKQSNSSKTEEKLKVLQTEIYAELKQLKNKMEIKVSTTDYQKNLKIQNDRLQGLAEQILIKSDKIEVKKALLFLQSKIKEIIIVISQEQQNQREALLTRKQIKCMSCDKEVDKFIGIANQSRGNWDLMPGKQMNSQSLGRFGMTSYGTISKKLKKLEGKEIPVCKKSGSTFIKNSSQHLDPISKKENL